MYHCLLASVVCDQFTVIQLTVPLCIIGGSLLNFGFDVHGCGFTYMHSSFLASWIYKYMSFTKIRKFFSHYFFKQNFCLVLSLLFFWDSNYLLCKTWYQPIGPWIYIFLQYFFSFYFRFLTGHQNSAYFFYLCSFFFTLDTFIIIYSSVISSLGIFFSNKYYLLKLQNSYTWFFFSVIFFWWGLYLFIHCKHVFFYDPELTYLVYVFETTNIWVIWGLPLLSLSLSKSHISLALHV